MMNFPPSWKRDQVFISFRGEPHRATFVSFLKQELDTNGINYYMDEKETTGLPTATLFQRIRESGVALVIFSDQYSESCWCLNELVMIKRQMEIGSIIPFSVFYHLKVDSVKKQTGSFGNNLFFTEEGVRKKVDRGSKKSILETEATIWERREALASVGGDQTFVLSHKHITDMDFLRELVIRLKKLLDKISSPRNIQTVIEKLLMHPQEAVTSLLQALNLRVPDLKDLITKTSIHFTGLSDDHTVFLDLNSLNSPALSHRLIKTGQSGKILLVLLGSLEDDNERLIFTPRVFPKKPQKFIGNKLISFSQQIQNHSDSLPVKVTKSNDNLQNLPGQSDDTLTCFSLLRNIVNCFAMIINPPPQGVSISFGEKQLGPKLVSHLRYQLRSNRFSVPEESEMKDRFKESKIAIVIFSSNYPESQRCLDELVEIKRLMDAGEIGALPIFYDLDDDESVKEPKVNEMFLLRLLKIEYQVRKNVNRRNERSILDTETKIWGWRDALKSIASKPSLSNEHYRNDAAFVSDIVTKVKAMFARMERKPDPTSSNTTSDPVVVEETPMLPQETTAITTTVPYNDNDLFYSPSSFLQDLNLETTDLEGFKLIPNGLASLSLRGYPHLVFLMLSSLDGLVEFQCSDSFQFLQEGLALTLSGVRRTQEPSRVLALEPYQSQQWANNNRLIAPDQDHHSNNFPAQIHNDTILEANMF